MFVTLSMSADYFSKGLHVMFFVFGFAVKGFLSNAFNVFGKNTFTQIILRL